MSLAWCFLITEVAQFIGLSYEIGAFVAGISLATSKVGLFLAEELKSVREFFLILFFFTIGAKFDLFVTKQVFLPGFVLAGCLLLVKPFIFKNVFAVFQEFKKESKELGLRLGQASEFSLLVSYGALAAGKIGEQAYALIQLTVIITFMISTYIVVFKYRTPISSQKG